MPPKTWKAVEGRIARFFGTERTPLSGSNSKITSSDSLHSDLYIETKHRKDWAVFRLFDDTAEKAKKENKKPILALHRKNQRGFLIVIHSDFLR